MLQSPLVVCTALIILDCETLNPKPKTFRVLGAMPGSRDFKFSWFRRVSGLGCED